MRCGVGAGVVRRGTVTTRGFGVVGRRGGAARLGVGVGLGAAGADRRGALLVVTGAGAAAAVEGAAGALGCAGRAAARRRGLGADRRGARRSRTVGWARTERTSGARSGASSTPAFTGSELSPTGWRASRLAPRVSPAVKAIPTTASAQMRRI
jgi:hypothetical protein